ncbi:hypothetical protein HN592_03550 [Candidatus Woesearchaeota archaeon]|jgi:hypothetical protein|nr:hypothetical protein [Candidatus Woesearchaeota archaeon]MBT4368287.1 hypothetical protein [Candidatus Woesearchaeota archaeon]MBT4712776.1 hypothetical protein [Candidatus Woesearchaeota archaeon]MBT6639688.1 hypothetical protein [Candidatus Woesearchaeota archaeon]MBT7133860.1 hypothetical protein [Candidatus Woesearchaeota archaeon]
MNKKGALELSVNAIVILIIALAVLGLVIGFAVSKFRDVSSQLTINEETPEPTSSQPITLPGGRNTLQLSKKTETLMELKIYNPSATTISTSGAFTGAACSDMYTGQNDDCDADFLCTNGATAVTIPSLSFQLTPCTGGQSNLTKCEDIALPNTKDTNAAAAETWANLDNADKKAFCENYRSCTWTTGTNCESGSSDLLTCSPSGFTYDLQTAVGSVAPGDTKSIPARLKINGSTIPGKYACNLKFSDDVSRTVFIEVE